MLPQVDNASGSLGSSPTLLYAGANAETVRSDLPELAGGVVLHGAQGMVAARQLRSRGYRGLVAWDADWYAASAPPLDGMFGLMAESVQNQLAVGADILLSPSTMPSRDDPDAITKHLAAAASFIEEAQEAAPARPAYVVLPIAPAWTTSLADRLLADVTDAGLPIALVLAAWGDPLDDPAAIDTVLELIASNRVISLRCDLSAIGMVASGAELGAIGQTSTNRHLFLPSSRRPPPSVKDGHVFVPELANWLKRSALEKIPSGSPVLICSCRICDGESVGRFVPIETRTEADRHATAAIGELAQGILAPEARSERLRLWRSYCRGALSVWEEGPGMPKGSRPPGFLVGWTAWSI